MIKHLAIFSIVTTITMAVSLPFVSSPPRASSTETQGDFWRLPWAAGTSHLVGGNGYHDPGPPATHAGINGFALDFIIAEGDYEMAAQEGDVVERSKALALAISHGAAIRVNTRMMLDSPGSAPRGLNVPATVVDSRGVRARDRW